MIRQDPHTKAITSCQSDYVEKMTKARTRGRAPAESPATAPEVAELQRVNGQGQWLAKESRPDIAVQVSMAQQMLPCPTLGQVRAVNAMVRRAK
eukprot:10496182-Alexandrium_andersonii.AAC.1